MECPNCQNELPDEAVFCNVCGTDADGAAIHTPRHVYAPGSAYTPEPSSNRKPTAIIAAAISVAVLLGGVVGGRIEINKPVGGIISIRTQVAVFGYAVALD